MPSPNYNEYHKSITAELTAIKDRLKTLVTHGMTEGAFKEAILRSVLRKYVPPTLRIGRGFIVTRDGQSTELDLLIVDQSRPILFQDGDLIVVTPDSVRAIVEIKAGPVSASDFRTAVTNLGEAARLCLNATQSKPWLGFYVYAPCLTDERILDMLVVAEAETGHAVNCISLGDNRFFRFWGRGEYDGSEECSFRSYKLVDLSPSYFIGNLIDAISGLSRDTNSYAWFPLPYGKSPHETDGRIIDSNNEARRVQLTLSQELPTDA
jgi:hypothetical protein